MIPRSTCRARDQGRTVSAGEDMAATDTGKPAPSGELRLKRLRQLVLAEHAKAQAQPVADDEARRTFKKRLKKIAAT